MILPFEQYQRPTARVKKSRSLAQSFAESLLADAGLELERIPDSGRVLEL